jgi:sporulation protein YlmC with PRC-barrel domain
MLLLGSKLIGSNVLSLQTGRPIGVTTRAIIDPASLKIIAYFIEGPLVKQQSENILRVDEVREFSPMGMIVDSIEDLVAESDVVKIKKVLDLHFLLIGHKVITKKGKKVGKVVDYSVDSMSFLVQQLIVHKPIMSSFNVPEVTTHRSQIVEIDDHKIVIDDDKAKVQSVAAVPAPKTKASFVNPFRKEEALEPAKTKVK